MGDESVWVIKWRSQPKAAPIATLNVPFYPQTDNFHDPEATCNSSACAMAAKFLGAKITGDDEYLAEVLRRGRSVDHDTQTATLQHFGIKSTFHTNLDWQDLDNAIFKGKPVVIGILHRGPDDSPRGEGHIIIVIGKTATGYICHDPYGSLLDGYTSDVQSGNRVHYSKSNLQRRWLVEGANSGWGRLF